MSHPEPDFGRFKLRLAQVSAGWHRIHPRAFDGVRFGRKRTNRFDDPSKQYGVLYAGEDEYCAFIETFGHDIGVNLVTKAQLVGSSLTTFRTTRPLRLVDLRGEGLARIGADARLFAGESHAAPQRWSRAIYLHGSRPDGIWYRARHDPSKSCVALFERKKTRSMIRVSGVRPLDPDTQRVLIGKLLDHYSFGYAP